MNIKSINVIDFKKPLKNAVKGTDAIKGNSYLLAK